MDHSEQRQPMTYRFPFLMGELKNNLETFRTLLIGTEEMARWKPDKSQWCLLEVVCHLYDEEREDFRAAIDHIFSQPHRPLTLPTPRAWVEGRKYLQQDYLTRMGEFFFEREESLHWLENKIDTVIPASWDFVVRQHPFGEISAYDFLENWLAHDYLHLQQILRIKFQYWSHVAGNPFSYARG